MTKKKILVIAIVAMGFWGAVNAQVDTRNIGLRLTSGAEVSYQQPLGSSNRLELDLGLTLDKNYDIFNLAGVYQWVWDLSALTEGFNWYAGAGAAVGLWSASHSTELNVGVLGQIGIEYNFSNIPLQLSLDYRPQLDLLHDAGFYGYGVALGVRYKF